MNQCHWSTFHLGFLGCRYIGPASMILLAILQHPILVTKTLADEGGVATEAIVDISDQVLIAEEAGQANKNFRITGPAIRKDQIYSFKIEGGIFEVDTKPEIVNKSCGCITPELTGDDDNWSLDVQVRVSSSHTGKRYVERMDLNSNVDLRVSVDFEVLHDYDFETDRTIVDFSKGSANVVVTGRWIESFDAMACTFNARPNYLVTASPPQIEPLEGDNRFKESGKWTLAIEPTVDPSPNYCWLTMYDGDKNITDSFDLKPVSAGRLRPLDNRVTFRAGDGSFHAKLMMRVSEPPVTENQLQEIRIEPESLNVSLKRLAADLIVAELSFPDSAEESSIQAIEVHGLGSSHRLDVIWPLRPVTQD